MNRTALVIGLLLSCMTCFGQTSFHGLTPGKSTRADVERALGQPTNQVSERLFEYEKGGQQIYVQYGKSSPAAVRIQVIYEPPRERSEVISVEGLPRVADTRRANKQGTLEEYFGYPKYVVLTYKENSQTEVAQIGYYSRELFEAATPELTKVSAPATGNPPAPAPRPHVSDIPSLGADVMLLRFYESGKDDVPFGQRNYQTRFAKETTRGVYVELNLSFPDPGRQIDFTMEIVLSRDGAFHFKIKTDFGIQAGWTSSHHSQGIGWADPGKWRPGAYLAELFVEGRKIAAASFEVY